MFFYGFGCWKLRCWRRGGMQPRTGASKSCHAVVARGDSGQPACSRCVWRPRHPWRQGCTARSAANSAWICASTSAGRWRDRGTSGTGTGVCGGGTAAPGPSVRRMYVRWRGGRSAMASSQRSLFNHARTVATAAAPSALQIMPACLSRAVTTCLQALSTLPLPMCSPRARYAA